MNRNSTYSVVFSECDYCYKIKAFTVGTKKNLKLRKFRNHTFLCRQRGRLRAVPSWGGGAYGAEKVDARVTEGSLHPRDDALQPQHTCRQRWGFRCKLYERLKPLMNTPTHCLPRCFPRRRGYRGRRRPSTRARYHRCCYARSVETACGPSALSVENGATWGGWSPWLARPRCHIAARPRSSVDSESPDTFHQATGVSLLVHLTHRENQIQWVLSASSLFYALCLFVSWKQLQEHLINSIASLIKI